MKIVDERIEEKFKVKLLLHVGEVKVLQKIFEKFCRVLQGETPQDVGLTENEQEIMQEFMKNLAKIN